MGQNGGEFRPGGPRAVSSKYAFHREGSEKIKNGKTYEKSLSETYAENGWQVVYAEKKYAEDGWQIVHAEKEYAENAWQIQGGKDEKAFG